MSSQEGRAEEDRPQVVAGERVSEQERTLPGQEEVRNCIEEEGANTREHFTQIREHRGLR